MPSEIVSTVRPTRLRLAGFLCLAWGAVLAGIGATREWAVVGFPGDELGAVDVSWKGTDAWEGKVVLFCAVVALIALLAMRLTRSRATRRALAILMVVVGLACAILPILDGVDARDRFGGDRGVDRMAEVLAGQLELPEDIVREQLADQFELQLRVVVGPGLWLSAIGGLLLFVGGVLSLMWIRQREAAASPAQSQS